MRSTGWELIHIASKKVSGSVASSTQPEDGYTLTSFSTLNLLTFSIAIKLSPCVYDEEEERRLMRKKRTTSWPVMSLSLLFFLQEIADEEESCLSSKRTLIS